MKIRILLSAVVAFTANIALTHDSHADTKAFEKQIEQYLATDKGKELIGQTVESYMQERQVRARKQAEEQANAELERQFKNPVKIEIGNSPVKGPKDAKVTVIEFSDFQCPYCVRGKETMDQLLKAYPNDVKLVFKNLPLGFHQQAVPAAKAALAAGKQGKFWEMHDELFANQQKLNGALYEELAKKLELDVAKFKKDMEDPEIAKQIEDDKKIAAANDIQGTPGFFVNGVAVRGAYPLEHFKTIVDRWLKEGK